MGLDIKEGIVLQTFHVDPCSDFTALRIEDKLRKQLFPVLFFSLQAKPLSAEG